MRVESETKLIQHHLNIGHSKKPVFFGELSGHSCFVNLVGITQQRKK